MTNINSVLARHNERRSERIKNRTLLGPYVRNGADGDSGGGDGGGERGGHAALLHKCKCGGTKAKKKRTTRTQNDWEVAPSPVTTANAVASETVTHLCQGSLSNLTSESSQEWIQSLKALVEGRGWADENGAFIVNSVESLVARCKRSLEVAVGVEFVALINMVHLAAKTIRYVAYYQCAFQTKLKITN